MMKIFSFVLMVALLGLSAAVPSGLYDVDPQDQTSKDLYCRKQFQKWTSCVIAQDYVGAGAWKPFGSRACTDTYNPATDRCKGSHYVYRNSTAATKPAFFVSGWITTKGNIETYMVAPGSIQKPLKTTCASCTKFMKRILSDVLPVKNPTPDPWTGVKSAIEASLNPADLALYQVCDIAWGTYGIPNGADVTYLLVTPEVKVTYNIVDGVQERCPDVETMISSKGSQTTRTLKGNANWF